METGRGAVHTELLQLLQVQRLLLVTVLEDGVEGGLGEGEPALLGPLQVQAALVLQPPDPLEVVAQQLIRSGVDEGLSRGQQQGREKRGEKP